ncbi:unnamed protein product [Cochlearia groenlandica]
MELILSTIASWFTPTTLFLLLNLMIGTIVITSRTGSDPRKHHPLQNRFGSGHDHAPSLIDRVKSINFHLYKFPNPESDLFSITAHHDVIGSDIPVYPDLDPNPAPLQRAPSLLDRVRSINTSYFKLTRFSSIRTGFGDQIDPPGLIRAPSILERVKSIKLSSFYGSDPETHSDHNPDYILHEEPKPMRIKSEPKKPVKKKKTKKSTKSASEKSGKGLIGSYEEAETAESVERRRADTSRVERSTSFGEGEGGVDAKASDFINRFKEQLKLQRHDSILRYKKEMLKSN